MLRLIVLAMAALSVSTFAARVDAHEEDATPTDQAEDAAPPAKEATPTPDLPSTLATEEPAAKEPVKREFAKLDEKPMVSATGTVTLQQGVAIPAFVVDTALFGKPVENAWLPPLTCAELGRVRQAVYARHNVYFAREEDRDFFASILYEYKPDPHNSPASVAGALKSVDQLNLLRVERELGAKGCMIE